MRYLDNKERYIIDEKGGLKKSADGPLKGLILPPYNVAELSCKHVIIASAH